MRIISITLDLADFFIRNCVAKIGRYLWHLRIVTGSALFDRFCLNKIAMRKLPFRL